MAKRGVKKKDHERLDDSTVCRVIDLLAADKPITKKAACEILNISYNPARFNKIIQEYKDNLEYGKRRRSALKGTPIEGLELQDLVVSYLKGEPLASISRRFFRSVHVLKAKIKDIHLPEKETKPDYRYPALMPEEMVAEKFDVGEYVWSAKYSCVVEIVKDRGNGVYDIYIFGKYMQFGIQAVHELGKLDILKQFKLRDDDFQTATQDFNMRIV